METTKPASELIDTERLEREVKAMYRDVAEDPERGDFHFELGRELAERLGYPAALLDRLPAEAVESFAGVGYALDLAQLREGETVLDLGSGSGTDVFAAATMVGPGGHVDGVDMTDAQLEKAERLRAAGGVDNVALHRARIESLPFDDGSFDVVISNGVINLSPEKEKVFTEVGRVLRPGGRMAVADIVSERPIADRTVAKVELWAACVAGAITDRHYEEAVEAAGLRIETIRPNDAYGFVSDRAEEACAKYGVHSASILAVKAG